MKPLSYAEKRIDRIVDALVELQDAGYGCEIIQRILDSQGELQRSVEQCHNERR